MKAAGPELNIGQRQAEICLASSGTQQCVPQLRAALPAILCLRPELPGHLHIHVSALIIGPVRAQMCDGLASHAFNVLSCTQHDSCLQV